MEYIRKRTGSSVDIDSVGGHDAHLSLSDIGPRDAATEAVGSILAGLGSNIMDTDNLNQTFAELGKLSFFQMWTKLYAPSHTLIATHSHVHADMLANTHKQPYKTSVIRLGAKNS